MEEKQKIAKQGKKILKEKPYNCGTMTNSAFWGMIRSTLRQRSRYWLPVAECKKLAKRAYKGSNKKQRFEYRCNICKEYFSDKEISVDHILPAGKLTGAEDLPGFVTRLFCKTEDLQCLCDKCHNTKTQEERVKLKEGGEVV